MTGRISEEWNLAGEWKKPPERVAFLLRFREWVMAGAGQKQAVTVPTKKQALGVLFRVKL